MRGKTGEMERVRNERIGQKLKKGRETKMNVGEEEEAAAAVLRWSLGQEIVSH